MTLSDTEPDFKAMTLRSVRYEDLRTAAEREGMVWDLVGHITATASLAKAFLDVKTPEPAIAIADFLDLFVVGTREKEGKLSLNSVPEFSRAASALRVRHEAIDSWTNLLRGKRAAETVKIDNELRKFARDGGRNDQFRWVLVKERREFQRAMRTLIAAGQEPDAPNFKPTTSIGVVARDAWRWIESKVPELTYVRHDLWSGCGEEAVLQRLRACLQRLFGDADHQRWTLMHHGFYFYTPQQWALFRLLRRSGLANQYFVLHDDGSSPVFESWRRFFTERLEMPSPDPSTVYGERAFTPQASAFLSGWLGRYVDGSGLGDRLRIVRYRNPAELVSELRLEMLETRHGAMRPKIFAASQSRIEGLIERLSPDSGVGLSSLAQLPIGVFLIGLHESIQVPDGVAGPTQIILSDDGVRDIALSGFLPSVPSGESVERMRSVLQRARPFFSGCRRANEWISRAEVLERIMIDVVAPFGQRGVAANRVLSIRQAVGNPLRLVPWVDLSLHEAKLLKEVIKEIAATINQLASGEQMRLDTHAEFLRAQIRRGLEGLNEAECRKVLETADGLRLASNDEIDVSGLIDVVRILLGRDADSDDDGHRGSDPQVKPLRSLDSLGLYPSSAPVHLTNLVDGAFPSSIPAVGWPFCREDLASDSVARQIFETRAGSAALGDLYLLWLALDGVCDQAHVVLSWMDELAGEELSPAAVLSMLRKPSHQSQAVLNMSGGVNDSRASQYGDNRSLRAVAECKSAAVAEVELGAALEALPVEVVASFQACPRRLALQWLFGQSHAFTAAFHHVMLYGNMIGTLVRKRLAEPSEARSTCDSVWRFMSQGERRGSEMKSAVKKVGITAKPEWMLTLCGRQQDKDPMSLAYQHATERRMVAPDTVVKAGSSFLPLPIYGDGDGRGEVCRFCPAKDRCLMARTSRDEQV